MDYVEIEKITEKVKRENVVIGQILTEMKKVIFGQDQLIERLMMAFLCNGHILLEGLPGLAKTLAVKCFSRILETSYNRIQFTPDLLPADLIGTQIYNPKDMQFFTKKGPLFTNFLLADEINRAPAKVQSALLQAMEERQVTIGDTTFSLDSPFMVLATENPIEQEGTYPLPEAQLDRFFMKCIIRYPDKESEIKILRNYENLSSAVIDPVITSDRLMQLRSTVSEIYMDDKIVQYIVDLIAQTRNPTNSDLASYIEYGASPRASIALMNASRCSAFIKGRGFVTPEDVKEVGLDVLRHRIILSYEAEAGNIDIEHVCKMVFDTVEVP